MIIKITIKNIIFFQKFCKSTKFTKSANKNNNYNNNDNNYFSV